MTSAPSRPHRRSKPRDPLSQLLASGSLRTLILYFATHPEEAPTVRALARAGGLGPASVEAEIARLTALGLIQRRSRGKEVKLDLQQRAPLWVALRAVVRTAAHPADVLRAALADVSGIEEAFVFGSFADEHHGTSVRPDSDVDVLIIGAPDERRLARRTIDAGVLLGRDVNAVTLTPEDWAAEQARGRPFYRSVADGPKRWIARGGVIVRSMAAVA